MEQQRHYHRRSKARDKSPLCPACGEGAGLVEHNRVHARHAFEDQRVFQKTPMRASNRCAVPSANGAASASAHGHATISTEVNALSAPADRRRHTNHKIAAPTAIAMTRR